MSGRKGDQSFRKSDQIWAGTVDVDGLGAFLRERHPVKTAQAVEARTGLPADSVRKWLSGEALPGFRATMILLGVYGLDFAAACIKGCEQLEHTRMLAELAMLKADGARVKARQQAIEQHIELT